MGSWGRRIGFAAARQCVRQWQDIVARQRQMHIPPEPGEHSNDNLDGPDGTLIAALQTHSRGIRIKRLKKKHLRNLISQCNLAPEKNQKQDQLLAFQLYPLPLRKTALVATERVQKVPEGSAHFHSTSNSHRWADGNMWSWKERNIQDNCRRESQ